jgi:sepiapterin reductase
MATSSSSSSVVFLITGASRGLGRAIATVAGKHYAQRNNLNGSFFPASKARFLLVARSVKGMEDTKKELLSVTTNTASSTTTTTTPDDVICRSMDLSDLDRLDSNIDVLLQDLDKLCSRDRNSNNTTVLEKQQQQQHLVFVNNAASLGHLGPSWKSPSLEDMRQTVDLNVTGSLWLSVRFARYVKEFQQQQQQHQNYRERNHQIKMGTTTAATIVNISSLVAVSKDFAGMGIYSAGKAAREMYHTLLAKDEDDEEEATETETETKTESPNTILLKTLNYASGPLETTMTQDIRDSDGLDPILQSKFQTTKLLDPEDSARKLIELLDTNEFESGSHIDYYDLL